MGCISTLTRSTLAGICIGIAATAYLSVDNPIVGSLLFSIGLLAVVIGKLELYTGKVGYVRLTGVKDLVAVWIGNLVGVGFTVILLIHTRLEDKLIGNAVKSYQAKSTDSTISLFILAIFCGILMFIAVDGYKATKNPVVVILPVVVFILCGFEHSIADMYYYIVGMACNPADMPKGIAQIIIISIGNATGAIGFNQMRRWKERYGK